MAIYTRFDLQIHYEAHNTSLTADALFGFFTIFFLLCIIGDTNRVEPQGLTDPLLNKVIGQTRRYLVEAVQQHAAQYNTLPAISDILENIRRTPSLVFPPALRDEIQLLDSQAKQSLHRSHMEFIDTELRGQYGHLRPVDLAREK